uniref:Nonstructural protein n=1 Tax=Dulem virus 194 TaxID=3145671 RepID=A0AAU8B114_9VIRU
MSNLYVFRDTVSGNTGDVFQAANDAVMRRSCTRSLASASPEIAHDTVVLCIGTLEFDVDNVPIVRSSPPRIALSGSSPDVDLVRDQLMREANRYLFNDGGVDDEA